MCFELPRLHVQHLPSSEESCRSKAEEAKSLQVAIMSIPVSHKSQPLQSAVPPKASIVRTRRSCRKRAMKRDLPRIRISSFVTMWWLMAVASRRFREMGFNMIKSGGIHKSFRSTVWRWHPISSSRPCLRHHVWVQWEVAGGLQEHLKGFGSHVEHLHPPMPTRAYGLQLALWIRSTCFRK